MNPLIASSWSTILISSVLEAARYSLARSQHLKARHGSINMALIVSVNVLFNKRLVPRIKTLLKARVSPYQLSPQTTTLPDAPVPSSQKLPNDLKKSHPHGALIVGSGLILPHQLTGDKTACQDGGPIRSGAMVSSDAMSS